MRVLVAPQELKGTLTAGMAAEAIARGLRGGAEDAGLRLELELVPIADGGPGTVDAFVRATGAERVETEVEDPLGRPVRAAFAAQGTRAVIEMAAASGLWRLTPGERDPLRASTRGTGQLVSAALDRGCKEIWVGLGGSATTDGGAGALEALGARLLDAAGEPLPPGGAALARLERVELGALEARLRGHRLVALTDVRVPLLGPSGAAAVFGPQKGASPEAVATLERALDRLHQVARRQLGRDLAGRPGVGAAGGLGYGLVLAGAELCDGFAAVAELLQLRERIRRADLVVTAEGRLDAQTAMGKGPGALAALAGAEGRPVVVLAGSIAPGAPVGAFALVEAIGPGGLDAPLPSSAEASEALEAAARRLTRRFPGLRPREQD